MKIYILISLLALTLSTTCGFIFIPRILRYCKDRKLYDIPNQRKVHKKCHSTIGWRFIFAEYADCYDYSFIGLVVYQRWKENRNQPLDYLFCFRIVYHYAIGLIDDVFGVSAKKKFLVQIFVSSLPPIAWLYINNFYGFLGIEQVSFWVGAPLTVFILVFIMNAINLIDGIDGLSAGLSLIALVGFFYCFLVKAFGFIAF